MSYSSLYLFYINICISRVYVRCCLRKCIFAKQIFIFVSSFVNIADKVNRLSTLARVDYFSNGGPSAVSRRTFQDIVRSDPGYTPNIEHLVFPERKSSNTNLAGVADGSSPSKSKSNATNTGRSRLAEVFVRHYARGSSQDSSIASRKNHVNVRIRGPIVLN